MRARPKPGHRIRAACEFLLLTSAPLLQTPSDGGQMKFLKHSVNDQRGQGLIEYLVIVALMGVATIAIVRTMGQTVSSRFATITYALQGKKKQVTFDRIEKESYKKRDLGDFFEGAGERGSGQ